MTEREEAFVMTALLFKAEKCGEHAVHYLKQFRQVGKCADWEAEIDVEQARAAATFGRIFLEMRHEALLREVPR